MAQITRALARHWNSAFSRGPGYEHTPASRSYVADGVAGYFIDFSAKTLADRDSFPSNPASLAQRALGWHERSLRGDPDAVARLLAVCDVLEERAERDGGGIRWAYSVEVPKYGLRGRWYSALAQGQIASVFVRAHALTGSERHAELARGSIGPLLDAGSDLVVLTPDGPALEEAPSEPPSLILNGWIYGLWGLWDVFHGLDDAAAGAALGRTVECLRATLPRYDAGWWTLYSLFPHRVRDLAKPFYHRLHVDQTAIMYSLTGLADFCDASRRWAAYDRAAARARVVAQKALFVAARKLEAGAGGGERRR